MCVTELMRDIAKYAQGSMDPTFPVCLNGLRYSRVVPKQKWIDRTVGKINLPKLTDTSEELLWTKKTVYFFFLKAFTTQHIDSGSKRVQGKFCFLLRKCPNDQNSH